MGYTDLYLREKRAVVRAGEVLRVWPRRFDRTRPGPYGEPRADEEYVLTVGEAPWRPRADLGPEPTMALALRTAMALPGRAGVSVLVSRTLSRQSWH